MDMEASPIIERLTDVREAKIAQQTWRVGTLASTPGKQMCVVTTGIGLANAASAAARAHLLFNPSAYICAGTTGGLGRDTNVRDIIVGTSFTYSRADATAFGYAPGQVPGMPKVYEADAGLLDLLHGIETSAPQTQGAMLFGQVASSDAFVTEKNVEDTREKFPAALGADMESTAAAQVCASAGMPFVSVRAVSDLCGPAADQDFHIDGEAAAAISADAVTALVGAL